MTIAATLLPEFDQEMKTTRKVLERVPTDKGTWKPHEKSFSIGHLAQLACGFDEQEHPAHSGVTMR